MSALDWLQIDLDVDVHAVKSRVGTALHHSVSTDVQMVEMVLHAGPDISAADLQGGTPLQHAVACTPNFLYAHGLVLRSYHLLLFLHLTITRDGIGIGFVNRFRDTTAAASHFLGGHGLFPVTTNSPYSSTFRFRPTELASALSLA